jgi:hypothetical protein
MPNWIINKLSFEGDEKRVKELMNQISTFEELIDFQKIIPRPKSLDIPSGASTDLGYDLVLHLENGNSTNLKKRYSHSKNIDKHFDIWVDNLLKDEEIESTLEAGRIALENEKLYGHRDWYSWSIENWGTKWNTSRTYLSKDEIVFETAWSNPYPVIFQLSQNFPDLLIKLRFADESIGDNCGEYHFKNSEIVYQTEYDEVEACVLWGYDPVEMFDYMKRDKNINEILEDDNTDSGL